MPQVRDILYRVRTQILDDLPEESLGSGYDWVTDDADLLWSNEDLILYLDEAMLEFCLRRPLHDYSNTEITNVSVTAGVLKSVAIDERIIEIESVQLQSRVDDDEPPLYKYFQGELDRKLPNWRTYDKEVEIYCEDLDESTLYLIGELAASDTVLLSVKRMPLKQLHNVQWPFKAWQADTAYAVGDIVHAVNHANDHWFEVKTAGISGGAEPTWNTDGTDTTDNTVIWEDKGQIGAFDLPEINYRHHLSDLPLYMAYKAYLKHDSETYDLEKANHFFGRFENEVGPKISARDQAQRRRRANHRGRIREYYR